LVPLGLYVTIRTLSQTVLIAQDHFDETRDQP